MRKIGCVAEMNMKNRQITMVSIIVLLLVGSLLCLCAVVAAESTSVYLTVDSTPTKIGDIFIASINVADVEDLWGWNAHISWNPDVLRATKTAKGPFLTSEGAGDMYTPVVFDNDGGTFPSGLSQVLLERSSVSGGGVLVRISFEVIGTGNADLTLRSLRLLDSNGPNNRDIPFTIGQIPVITISSDPSPSSSPSPSPSSSPSPSPSSSPSPSPSSSPSPQGDPAIVVSTDKSSYAIGNLVSVSARITFNGGEVVNRNVAFTILQPDGTALGTYVDTTNSSGLAGFIFRVPAPEPDPAVIFGEWSILASVSVSEVVITDTAKFTVGSSLSIKLISISSSVQRSGRVPLNITLEGSIPEGLVLTASIFDSAQVPLGMSITPIKAQTQGTTTITTEVSIPSWAFTGQAIVYVNILTDLPDKSGTSCCSQATLAFQIT